MKHGAIFDMDGLLFDTERMYQDLWIVLAEEFGQTPNPQFPTAICGTSGERSLEVIREHYPAIDAEEYLHACIQRMHQLLETSVPEKPGIHEILDYLHRNGVKLAVASSSVLPMIQRNLRHAGIDQYFDAVISGEQVTRGKPEPDIFLTAAKQLGLPPEDCYVFEDGINGVHAGLAAGCATVMIPDLTPPTEEFTAKCAGIYPSLLDACQAIADGRL